MNSIFQRVISILVFGLIFIGCSNELDLVADDAEKTYVVFGILNCSDTLQQVRIRVSSVEEAQSTESFKDPTEFLAPDNLIVSIQEWTGDSYANWELRPIIYEKETGTFFQGGNRIYEALFNPDLNQTYKLVIEDLENDQIISSKIEAIPPPILVLPSWPGITYPFAVENNPFRIRFKTAPRGYVYQITFKAHYLEVTWDGDSTVQVVEHLFPPLYYDTPPDYSPERMFVGREFTQAMSLHYTIYTLAELIAENIDVKFRQLKHFSVSVWAGDKHLKEYIQLKARFNDDRRLLFNNIINGFGVFGASSYTECTPFYPDEEFLDSLILSPSNQDMKFIDGFYKKWDTQLASPFDENTSSGGDHAK